MFYKGLKKKYYRLMVKWNGLNVKYFYVFFFTVIYDLN